MENEEKILGLWGKRFFQVCKPRENLSGSKWADKFRYVAPGTSPEPGEWRTSRVPYLREPLDAATDKVTEKVVLMFASQCAKSEMLLNVMGYYCAAEPSPQLMLQPTIEAAENFSKERIEPTFKYSPGLKDKLEEGKDGRSSSRKKSTTIRMKHFAGGYIAMVGANSPAGLASRPIRVLLADEIDRYGTTKEGDPLELALQRTQNFHNRKIVMVSTPTIAGSSNIEREFNESDQRKFFVPCPKCGADFVYKWDLVKWDKTAAGEHDPMTARIVCPECGGVARGTYRPDPSILEKGRWVAENPGAPVKGYHLSALYSPWVNLFKIVERFLKAYKDRDKKGLMEFFNLVLGEPWHEENLDTDEWKRLYRRREFYPLENLPEGVLILTAGIDVQRDRFEVSVYGWGAGRERWGILHKVIYGRPDDPETQRQLDALILHTTFVLSTGAETRITCTCMDSGDGEFTNVIYKYTRQREAARVFSIKGRGGIGVPFISPPTKNNAAGATLFTLGVDSGKSIVMNNLKLEDPGPAFIHFSRAENAGFNEEFFKQLTAEIFVSTFEKGKAKTEWRKIRERNEALDCAVYATAALELVNPNFEYLQEYFANGGPVKTKTAARPKRPQNKGIQF